MNKKIFIFLFAVYAFGGGFYYPKNDNALGFLAGSSFGIVYKSFLDPTQAISASIFKHKKDNLGVNIDTIFHQYGLISKHFSVYYGLGLKSIYDKKHLNFGLRMPFGINYLFKEAPFDLFVELAPAGVFFEKLEFDLDAFVGFRLWF